MYCPSCGKQIPDNSRFCNICGARTDNISVQAIREWENHEFVMPWKSDQLCVRVGGGNPNLSPDQALTAFWNDYQSEVRIELQKWLDQGWQTMTEVGPASVKIQEYYKDVSDWDSSDVVGGIFSLGLLPALKAITGNGSHKETWWKPTEVHIKLRRPSK
jgi:hypothetical protein